MESAYFAGEIVNPTNDYVVLYKNDVVVDSAKLDANNRFTFKLNALQEGLYHFDHAPQYQYVFLEKGDSLLIRLNASPAYFDESLVFSGDNAAVNNFMIEMFLMHEDEEQLIYSYFKLPPKDFSSKMDSLRNQKLEELEELTSNEEISESGYAIAKAAVDYVGFMYKEKYPFYHKTKTGENTIHQLGEDFYHYRKNLNLNDKRLSYFRPYYYFQKHYFSNMAYMYCHKYCKKNTYHSVGGQLHLNRHKLAMIDSMVTEKNIRDNLLRNVAMDYLLKIHMTNDDCDNFIQKFKDLSKNEKHIKEIKNLYKGIKELQPKSKLPHLVLENSTGDSITLKDIANNKRAVFYFWTADQKSHFKNIQKQVTKLKNTCPDYNFVGINLKTGKSEWNRILQEADLDRSNQFRSLDFKTLQRSLILDHINKCIVTEDTLIVNAFGNIYTSFDDMTKF